MIWSLVFFDFSTHAYPLSFVIIILLFIAEKKKVTINPTYLENPEELITEAKAEDTTVVNVIDHKALTNEINKRFGLGLNLNTNGLKAEIKETEEESCHVIYVISVTNLKDFYKFAEKKIRKKNGKQGKKNTLKYDPTARIA